MNTLVRGEQTLSPPFFSPFGIQISSPICDAAGIQIASGVCCPLTLLLSSIPPSLSLFVPSYPRPNSISPCLPPSFPSFILASPTAFISTACHALSASLHSLRPDALQVVQGGKKRERWEEKVNEREGRAGIRRKRKRQRRR